MTRPGAPAAAGAVQEGALCALLVLLPFSKAAIEIAFAVWLAAWLWQLAAERGQGARAVWSQPSLRPLGWMVAVFWAFCALSVATSTLPRQSLEALISKWSEYLLFLTLAVELAARRAVWRRGRLALACGAALVVAEGLTQELGGRGLLRGYALSTFERMTGPYENPIDLATYIMLVLPALALAAWRGVGVARWGYGALAGVLGLCLIRTEALGAWVALAASLIAVAGFVAPLRRLAAGLLGLGAAGATILLVRRGQLDEVLSLTADIGKQDRWYMWQAGWRMFLDRPWSGQGLNTFMAHYLEFWVGGERHPRYAHNCYLQMAAEIGWLGAAAFITVLGGLLRTMARLLPVSGEARWLVCGLLIGTLAFVLQAAIDTNFYSMRQAALFWTLGGLAAGTAAAKT